jgi:hypothetical protein
VFRYQSKVFVPYPAGFSFPRPNLTTGYVVEGQSKLDPFYWLQAVDDPDASGVLEGEEREVVGSNGEVFSLRYRVGSDGGETPRFEYVNHSQGGRFRLHRLSWVDLSRSRHAPAGSPPDTLTLSGFGTWEKDGHQRELQVAAQVSTAPGARYVGVQVAGGGVSNVNTKPPEIRDALP